MVLLASDARSSTSTANMLYSKEAESLGMFVLCYDQAPTDHPAPVTGAETSRSSATAVSRAPTAHDLRVNVYMPTMYTIGFHAHPPAQALPLIQQKKKISRKTSRILQ